VRDRGRRAQLGPLQHRPNCDEPVALTYLAGDRFIVMTTACMPTTGEGDRSCVTRVASGPEATHRRYSGVIRPLRYSINVTLDGCCDHRAVFSDEDLHRHAAENLDQADALLLGRVTYEMMEAAFR
jgi:hypothetical protein